MHLNFRQWVGALVVLGILLVGVGIIVSGKPPPPPPSSLSASVAAFSGEAFACDHTWGCLTPAIAGTRVYTDGEAATGPTGKADLQTDTVVFRLDHGSRIHFKAVTDSVTDVVLRLGRLFVSHDPEGRDQIYVEAGRLLIAAIDTRFSVVVDDATGTVDGALDRGVYIAVPPDGGRVIVHLGTLAQSLVGGEELYVPPAATALPAPGPISADEIARWNAVSCDWQGIAPVLTPGALPTPNGCGPPPTEPPVNTPTEVPPTAAPPPAPDTPVVVPPPVVIPPPVIVPPPIVVVPPPVTVVVVPPPPDTVTPVPPGPSDTPTDTPTNTPTDTPTNTPTDTPTETPTPPPPVITVTLPPQVTYTPPTNTPTNTPTFTPSWTPTFTVVPPTWTPTNTPTRTASPIITTSPPIGDTAPYRGTWLITDQSASRLTKLWINPDGSLVAVHWFSDCGAKICDLDATVARLEADGLKINAPVYGTVLLTMPDANTLQLEGHGGVARFRRATAADYVGTWISVNNPTNSLTIRRAAGGTLDVMHCSSQGCNTTTGVPYDREPWLVGASYIALVDAAHSWLAVSSPDGYIYYQSNAQTQGARVAP